VTSASSFRAEATDVWRGGCLGLTGCSFLAFLNRQRDNAPGALRQAADARRHDRVVDLALSNKPSQQKQDVVHFRCTLKVASGIALICVKPPGWIVG
jgi:hypothetical protein